MSTVLFVTKDAASKPAIPFAKLLQNKGHTVQVVCEGLSSALWYGGGFEPYFVGTVNVSTEPFTLSAKRVLQRLKPKIVIVCEGNPINLEQSFGRAANGLGIPLVFLEDFWNGFRRNTADPQVILTIDEYAAQLARGARPLTKVFAVGSCQTITRTPPSLALSKSLATLKQKCGLAVLYVGGETTEDLALLTECMKLTSGFVIPRFHPKHKAFVRKDGKTREQYWRSMLSALGDRVVWFDAEPIAQLIAGADVVCSGLSLALVEAVSSRNPAIVLQTAEASALLERIVGLPVHPLVPLGLVHMVESPTDLSQFKGRERGDSTVLRQFSAEAAYKAIEEYL